MQLSLCAHAHRQAEISLYSLFLICFFLVLSNDFNILSDFQKKTVTFFFFLLINEIKMRESEILTAKLPIHREIAIKAKKAWNKKHSLRYGARGARVNNFAKQILIAITSHPCRALLECESATWHTSWNICVRACVRVRHNLPAMDLTKKYKNREE